MQPTTLGASLWCQHSSWMASLWCETLAVGANELSVGANQLFARHLDWQVYKKPSLGKGLAVPRACKETKHDSGKASLKVCRL